MDITVQNVLSICLFLLFVIMVLVRAVGLRRRGIRVIVFGRSDRSDFLLVPLVLAIAYTVSANTFGWPMWEILLRPFWRGAATGLVGLALCAVAGVGFALTLVGFGDSFRVGIDEEKPDKLITRGMFSISRNPVYVCFILFFTGLFLVHRNIIIAAAVVLFASAIHRQVIREEKFLASHYGKEYEEYRRKVRRYL